MRYTDFVERIITGSVRKTSLNDFEGWEQAFALPADSNDDDSHMLYGDWKEIDGSYEPDKEGIFAALSHSDNDEVYIVWSQYVTCCNLDENSSLGDLDSPGNYTWAYTLPRDMMYYGWNEANPYRVLRLDIIEEFCLYSVNKLFNSYRHALWDLISLASEPELRKLYLAYPSEVETYLNLHTTQTSVGEILGDADERWREFNSYSS